MKKLKYIIIIIFISLACSLYALNRIGLTNIANYILEEFVNKNISISKLEIKNFSVEITGLDIKELDGKPVGVIDKARIYINPLLPLRISKIVLDSGNFKVVRHKDGSLNVENIVEINSEGPKSRISMIKNIVITNLDVDFEDESFVIPVKEKIKNVSGNINTLLQSDMYIKAYGNIGKGKIGFEYTGIPYSKENIWSIFSMVNPKDEKFYSQISFNFQDVDITESRAQYSMLDFLKIYSGKINGDLKINFPYDDVYLYGQLKIANASLDYEDFSRRLYNANAEINFNKSYITVSSNALVDDYKVYLNLDTDIKEKILNVDVESRKIPFKIVNDYKLVKQYGLNFEGDLEFNFLVGLDFKNDIKVTNINANINSKLLKKDDISFEDLDISMYKQDNDYTKIKLNTVASYDSYVKIKEKVSADIDLNLITEEGRGDISLKNLSEDIIMDDVDAKIIVNSFKDIEVSSNSSSLVSDFKYKNDKVYFTVKSFKDIGVIKDGVVSYSKIDIDNFVYDFKTKISKGNSVFETSLDIPIDNISSKLNIKASNFEYSGNSNDFKADLDIDSVIDFSKYGAVLDFSLKSKEAKINLDDKTITADLKSKAVIKYNNTPIDIDLDAKIKDNYLTLVADANSILVNAKLEGTTDKEMNHKYKFNGEIDGIKLLETLNILKDKNLKNNMKLSLSMDISGKDKLIDSNIDVLSENINILGIEMNKLKLSGNAKYDEKEEISMSSKLDISDLWLGYQRLSDISSDLVFDKGIISLPNIKNKYLNMSMAYDTIDKNLRADGILDNYVIYNTSKNLDINLLVNKLEFNAYGALDNLVANAKMINSPIYINKKLFSTADISLDLKDNILNFNADMQDSLIKGKYNIKEDFLNMNANIKKEIDIDGVKAKILAIFNASGKKESIKGDISLNLENLEYSGFNLPNLEFIASYKNLNILNFPNEGIIDVSKLEFKNSKGLVLYSTNTNLDLSNLNIDFRLNNKVYDLSTINDELTGKILVNGYLRGNFSNIYAELKVEGDNITLSNNNIDKLLLLVQFNNFGISIGQGYAEIEKNPVVLEGYILYNPLDYNIRMYANNFDLGFLKLDKNIKAAKGIADINFLANNGSFMGNISLKNAMIKTSLIDISNFNVDISSQNKDIKINDISANLNGGDIKIEGEFIVPSLDPNFSQNKRVILDKMDIRTSSNNVSLNLMNNTIIFNHNINIQGTRVGGDIKIGGGSIESLKFLDNTESASSKEGTLVLFIKEIVYNMLKQYIVDINLYIDKDINVSIPSYLIIKDIAGEISGQSNITVIDGINSLVGSYKLNSGNFIINGYNFNIDEAIVSFDRSTQYIDPLINFRASTTIEGDIIEISMNSRLSEKSLTFSSKSGKTPSEIVAMLAFKGTNFKINSINNLGNQAINIVAETAINQVISSLTNRLGKMIGLTKFDVNANVINKTEFDVNEFINNTNILVNIQGRILKDKNFFWNIGLDLPFNGNLNKLNYDMGLSYNLKNNLQANVGFKTTDGVRNNDINFYTGLSYSNKFNDFSDFLNEIKGFFVRNEPLKKEEGDGKNE